MTKNEKYIVDMYVRYFGKAPNVAEIAKYNEFGKPKQILNEIIKEYDDSKPVSPTDQINSVYQNLFGRDATEKEMKKYTKVVDAGKDLPINAIVKSAKKPDKGVYEAKKAIAIMLAEKENTTNYNLDKITKDTYAAVYDQKTKKVLVDSIADLETKIDAIPDNGNATGQTFTLTTDSPKNLILTAKNDLVEAGKFLEGKIILDQGGNDVLNASLTGNLTNSTTIQGVEKINLDWDAYSTATVNAANISAEKGKETTITLTSSKSGFLGDATVSNTEANNVTAGAGIKGTLTVTGITNSTINAEAAKAVVATGKADSDAKIAIVAGANTTDITASVYSNANIDAKNAKNISLTDSDSASTTSLKVENDAKVALNASTGSFDLDIADKKTAELTGTTYKELNVKGSGDVTLKTTVNNAKITSKKDAGTLTIETAETGATDIKKVQADVVKFTGDFNNTVTAKSGANIEFSNDSVAKVVVAASSLTNESVNLKASGANITALTVDATLENLVLTAAAKDVKGTDLKISTADLNGNNLIINGKNDVEITTVGSGTVLGNGVINASELDGNLKINGVAATTTKLSVVGSKGENSINFAAAASAATAELTAVLLGTKNTVTADLSATTTGSLVVSAVSGANTVSLASGTAAMTTGKINLDLGTGTDTLKLSGNDYLKANITATGLDVVEVATASTVVASSLLNGQSYAVKGTGATATFTVGDAASTTAQTIDLSKLSISKNVENNIDEITILGSNKADTIFGADTKNVIKAGTGNDKIDISKSANSQDSIQFNTAATNGTDTITGFKSNDKIQLDANDTTAATSAGTGAAYNAISTALVSTATAYTLGAGTTTNDVIAISTTLSAHGDLSKATDGTELLKALSSSASAAATGLTVANNGEKLYLLTYQDSKAYLYHADSGADANITATEIALVGVFDDITANGLTGANFGGML